MSLCVRTIPKMADVLCCILYLGAARRRCVWMLRLGG